jgi:hypothetical protein
MRKAPLYRLGYPHPILAMNSDFFQNTRSIIISVITIAKRRDVYRVITINVDFI